MKTIENREYLSAARRFIRAAGRRVADADVDELKHLVALRHELDSAIVIAVAGMRMSGATWQEIGEATGTSQEAAIQKWHRKVIVLHAGEATRG